MLSEILLKRPFSFAHLELFQSLLSRDNSAKLVVPILGRMIAKNKQAYQYLSTSAEHFPHGKEFQLILEKAGFENINVKYLSLGIVNIYCAINPE